MSAYCSVTGSDQWVPTSLVLEVEVEVRIEYIQNAFEAAKDVTCEVGNDAEEGLEEEVDAAAGQNRPHSTQRPYSPISATKRISLRKLQRPTDVAPTIYIRSRLTLCKSPRTSSPTP